MKIGFFLREALRSITRNAVPSFAALASVLVTLLVLGVFIPIVQATTGAANDVRSRVLVNVYLTSDATAADAAEVRSLLLKTEHVDKVQFVSKAQALREEKAKNPEAYELLGSNPLPDTFRITPDDPDNAGKIVAALNPQTPGGGNTLISPKIDAVKNAKDDTQKILVATHLRLSPVRFDSDRMVRALTRGHAIHKAREIELFVLNFFRSDEVEEPVHDRLQDTNLVDDRGCG